MTEVMDFESLAPIDVEVKYKGQTLTLRSANGAVGTLFKNKIIQYESCDRRDMADIQPWLVSVCLFRRVPDLAIPGDQGELVPVSVVRTFPHPMLKKLFDKAVEIGELIPEDETIESLEKKLAILRKQEAARKNGHESTGTGSS
jgi:hypothetical protein